MVLLSLFADKYTGYKAECSSHHAKNTFLCMRLNLRGPTPSETGMDDRQRTRKVINNSVFSSTWSGPNSGVGKSASTAILCYVIQRFEPPLSKTKVQTSFTLRIKMS